jgi:mono/diheme cytochrome c family protein
MRRTTALGAAAGAALGVWLLAGTGTAQSPPPGSTPAGSPPSNTATPGAAPSASPSSNAPAPPVEFAPEFLRDPKNVQRGRGVWQTRCQFCHGKTAYPGKAPKLDPSRYSPAFVYDRVANGFQGMPPWRHEFSVDELKSVVAYVLSRQFPD